VPRAVLDPGVLVSALIAPGGVCARLLIELRDGAFEQVASPRLLDELDGVLQRPKFRPYVTADEARAFVELVRTESTVVVDPPVSGAALSEDPDDDYLIVLARVAEAHVLVSGDAHLLRLADRLPIVSPAEFLRRLVEGR
jgi:putative PIN family toxin of toxin-antitoxin system